MDLYYRIKKNENLCKIAKKFKMDIKKLIELNEITNVDYLHEGDLIKIEIINSTLIELEDDIYV